jgi:hypothetical protein
VRADPRVRRARPLYPHRLAARRVHTPPAPRPGARSLPGFALGGMLLAVVSSAGILAERVAKGDAPVAIMATIATAGTTVLVVAATFRTLVAAPPVEAAAGRAPHRGWPSCVIPSQALAALLGVVLVHVAVRLSDLRACAWLCEEPRQLVNDLAAAFGALGLVWGCARRPVGALASLGAVAICAAYSLTAPRWHLDPWGVSLPRGSFGPISVQRAVLMQLACTAVGVSVLYRLRLRVEPMPGHP